MNSPIWDVKPCKTCWGTLQRGLRSDWWILVSEIYQTRPVWRQVPFTLEENQHNPMDLKSEVGEAMSALLKELRSRLESSVGEYLGPLVIQAMERGALPGPSMAEEQVYSMLMGSLDKVVLEALADHFSGPLTARIMEGVKACLAVQMECVPLNMHPEGQRGERYAGKQEVARRLHKVSRQIHPSGLAESEIAQTVVGRVVWDPMLMPILVRKEDLPNLIMNPAVLALQRIDWRVDGEDVELAPIAWSRVDLANPLVHPLGALPLEDLPDPLTPDAIKALLEGPAKGTPLDGALIALRNALEASPGMAWWTLVDLLDSADEKA